MSNSVEVPPPALSDQEVEQSLYAKREKIYPRAVHGIFARLRVTGILTLLGIYYFLPWLPWEGRQAVLFDLPARQFYVFGLTFWPQDFIYLALLMAIAGLSLFFFTAIAGRLWCGYACPQTVWTEVFLWMERAIEGDRLKQIKLDKAPTDARKLRIKATKHTAWILFSLYTGFTFVGYFTPIQGLAGSIVSLELGGWEWFWMLFYGFATYGNAGWMREQVCMYMCPYARFQSAMFDADTMIIAYDGKRGEQRGKRKRSDNRQSKGLGDCIDCTLCVQVCPTGIDIRDGLQYECIGCAACIDACDDVMDKMAYPKGLIRYTSENAVAGKPVHLIRPRVLIYGAILIGLFSGLVYAMNNRVPLDIDILRDRNQLFRETNEGLVENVYTLKIINKDARAHEYRLSAEGIEGMVLDMDQSSIKVESGQVLGVAVRLRVDPADLHSRGTDVYFEIDSLTDPELSVRKEARFLGPFTR